MFRRPITLHSRAAQGSRPRASLGSRCRGSARAVPLLSTAQAVPLLRVARLLLGLCVLVVLFVPLAVFFAPPAVGYGYFPIGRDTFPVFDDPPMIGAAQAEAKGLIFPRDAVIGVSHGGEAKAYPIAVMGIHELGNDSIGGVPIAVSW